MLKKALLLSTASAGALTLSSVATRPAQAQRYVSGSATVVNFTGSIVSVGGEVGGVTASGVVVTPTYSSGGFFGFNTSITNLNVAATINSSSAPLSIAQVVAQNLSAIAGTGATNLTSGTGTNLAAYVSIVRAAAGNDGLE